MGQKVIEALDAGVFFDGSHYKVGSTNASLDLKNMNFKDEYEANLAFVFWKNITKAGVFPQEREFRTLLGVVLGINL